MSTVTIQLSQHAVERFQQRVRPALSLLDAERELAQLALAGELILEPPAWHAATCAQIAEWYLVIADVVLPLKQHWTDRGVLVATTCLARGERSAEARHRRQRRGTTSQPRRRSLMGRP